MKKAIIYVLLAIVLATLCAAVSKAIAKDIERPEKVVSKRITVYDKETYAQLAQRWEQYYKEFPSEDAYGNWMYAARYAGDENYEKLLDKGLKKYSANPTLLYLKAMTKCGTHLDIEARELLERASRLDPSNMDVWFGLVGIYMDQNEDELTDITLRHLLEGNAIPEDIMDYNYNMLLGLKSNAILITNGDMDTYPGWMLTRILKHRPDVTIVNRSLLNTDWYPIYLIDRGFPKFTTKSALEDFRENIMSEIRTKSKDVPYGGPFGDTLIVRIIESAEQVGRPVYFSWTLHQTPTIKRYMETGLHLPLVTLVTQLKGSASQELLRHLDLWLNDFRTGGLDSWRLRYSKAGDSGKMIMANYAHSINALMDPIKKYAPDKRLDIFHWYLDHVAGIVSKEIADFMNQLWCGVKDINEIQQWCRRQGYLE